MRHASWKAVAFVVWAHAHVSSCFTLSRAREQPLPIDGVYEAQWDSSFGDGLVAMDTILFPDPAAPADVQEAAARQCLDSPHVMVIGFDIERTFGRTPFNCMFWTKDGTRLQEDGAFYPEVGNCSRQTQGPSDLTLVCRVPQKVLQEGWDEGIRVVLVNTETGRRISKVLLARGQVHNARHPAASSAVPTPRYRVSLTHMYKNHQPGIVNWIEWHLAKGIEHFFLYDNNSEDDGHYTEEYERKGIVTRVKWPFCCEGAENNVGQRGHMNHALFKFGQLTEWLMSLDEDEYLVTETVRAKVSDELLEVEGATSMVGVENSHIMKRGCNESVLQHGLVVQLGLMRAGVDCLPQSTGDIYPGKYLLRTHLAYELGFVYVTPHPAQMDVHLPGEKIASVTSDSGPRITIAHFQSDEEIAKGPHEVSEAITQRLGWIAAETGAFVAAKAAAAAATH